MRLHLEFNIDNAAYRRENEIILLREVAATVHSVANNIELHSDRSESSLRNASWLIVDPNGNTVGRWTFVDGRPASPAFPQHLLREDGPVDGPYPYHD